MQRENYIFSVPGGRDKMKMNIKYCRHILCALVVCATLMQICSAQDAVKPYYFDGNEVVFVFDVRNYNLALQGENAEKVDFADLKINDVAISGRFNDWSKKGWRMQQKSEFIFELRKHVSGFNEAFPLEFRYVINGKYIAEVEGAGPDQSKFADDFLKDVYKLDLSVLKVSADGNVVFTLKGRTNAREVILAGSFNNWDEHATQMHRTPTGWELRAELPPGKYEYKFIVDGEWIHDPANNNKVRNEHDTYNSVLLVSKPVVFTLQGHPDAKQVIVAGSFNNWDEQRVRMIRQNDVWTTTLDIPGGKQHYKFIVDGDWILDAKNPLVEDDGMGNLNSVLFVY
jgi:hypothetical protein